MIIEQSGKALELDTGPFRVYATKEELKALGYQIAQGSEKVHVGWVEIDSSKGMSNAEIKPQNPKTKKWME